MNSKTLYQINREHVADTLDNLFRRKGTTWGVHKCYAVHKVLGPKFASRACGEFRTRKAAVAWIEGNGGTVYGN